MRINRVKSEMHSDNEVLSDDCTWRVHCRNLRVVDSILLEKGPYWHKLAYNSRVTNRDEP